MQAFLVTVWLFANETHATCRRDPLLAKTVLPGGGHWQPAPSQSWLYYQESGHQCRRGNWVLKIYTGSCVQKGEHLCKFWLLRGTLSDIDTLQWEIPGWRQFADRYIVVFVVAVVVSGLRWQLIFVILILTICGLHIFFFSILSSFLVIAALSTANVNRTLVFYQGGDILFWYEQFF